MAITTIIKLKPEVIEAVKKGLDVKNRLQFELKISYLTLQRWLNTNDDKLTRAQVLQIISEELSISKEELLTE
ncbi:hypothetical protein [Mucilaginibacter sp. L196]|uniref:hypothetical protein n=1 Tax=Mucilaginibacter sp. L196 TaxID=1641870 RepID=UPI00131DE891|nr:hypothetical protein [Mucilaginibacter sp. L196]